MTMDHLYLGSFLGGLLGRGGMICLRRPFLNRLGLGLIGLGLIDSLALF